MATRMKIDAAVMPPFNAGDDPRNNWLKWKKALERFLRVNKIENDEEKYDLLLVLGAIELQSYYDKVTKWEYHHPVSNNSDETVVLKYESALLSLDGYFAPQLNKRFERHVFRAMKQENQERFEEFIFRLREQANRCLFADLDDSIVDQVIEGCRSPELRKKLLTEDLNLHDTTVLGKTLEEVHKQTKEFEKPSTSYGSPSFEGTVVQKIETSWPRKLVTNSSRKCYNCNKAGHLAKDVERCPARKSICHTCKTAGHFAVCCRKRKYQPLTSRKPPDKKGGVHVITSDQDKRNGVFLVRTKGESDDVLVLQLGGVNVRMLVDSGSPANIIDSKTYQLLRKGQAEIINDREPHEEELNLKSFASNKKINFSRVFETEVKTPEEDTGIWTHVLVAPEGQVNLLSKGTAFALGVLKIGYNVNQIAITQATGMDEFPKVPNVLLNIQVDKTIQPVVQGVRRFPIAMEADVEEAIHNLLKRKIIERAEGPLTWVSPLVPIRKTDGKIRLCVDMRAANKAIIRENYPMPNIDSAMATITKVAKMSKIDLESAYYHFELHPDSRAITTFVARSGVYRFCRLMFGIKSAPELFQREMENVFRGVKGLVVYMDDLLVHGETEEAHDTTLREVMTRIETMNMKVNTQKSIIGTNNLDFLGYHISENGIHITDAKLEAIRNLQPPVTVSDLRSLLGLINFLGRFVPNLSDLTFHMRQLLVKDCRFVWTDNHDKELAIVKQILNRVESLAFFDPLDETLLVTDASPWGLGAILIQLKNGIPRPIFCASKSLTTHEKKYCQTEKECYAIIWAMEKLFMYLYGLHFTLITDCKPLEYLFNKAQSKPSARIERWILRLQSFDFEVKYEPGENNLADPLSRLSVVTSTSNDEADVLAWLSEEIKPAALSIEEIENATLLDTDLQTVKDAIYSGDWDLVPIEYKTTTIRNELSLYGELLLRGDRIVIPGSLREKVIQIAHMGHQGSTAMKAQLRGKIWFPLMDKSVDNVVRNCKPCKMTSIPEKPNPLTRRLPTEPWQDLAIDFKEGLPDNVSLLVVVCYTSRFVQIEPMKPATTQRVIGCLLKMFSYFGIPRSITADNGPQFKAVEFSKFCNSYGIHLNLSTPYWPEQNGAVERQMRNIGKRLKISAIQGTDWKTDLNEYLILYHSTPQETTGLSPGHMMFGREMRNRIPSIYQPPKLHWEEARDKDMMNKEYHKKHANQKRQAKYHSLRMGDIVLMRDLHTGAMQPNFRPEEYKVTQINKGTITVKSDRTGKIYLRNSSHLKKLYDTQAEDDTQTHEGTDESTSKETVEPYTYATSEVDKNPDSVTDNEPRPKRICRTPKRFTDFILQIEDV
ncbi:uncharacterized protein K02A2.6-like [Malaya genurostris]|uniref:uncharacterized protein K02A2.6-like n=1 Tax=Malaya genurostris TaxID=325434 RepID=UPI0026F38C12|nr:uncharacterized protein K02A2.6-like [Malaya genurostris]